MPLRRVFVAYYYGFRRHAPFFFADAAYAIMFRIM